MISHKQELLFQYFKNVKAEKKLHKINSCTKSITSSLIGIAYDRGLLPELSTPISEFFPAFAREGTDERKRLITIDHLLTMSPGFDWPEMGEWGGWPQMIHSPNWVNYVLDRPLLQAPGESMNYNSGCSHLLLAILQKQTNQSVKQFAEQYLFSPLKFGDYIWHEDPQGIPIGGFGIHMAVQDMHKFGELYLNNGKWGSKRLISEQWIALTTRPEYATYDFFGPYGRHWWTCTTSTGEPFYFAMGMGGQYICVVPSEEIVITMTSDTHGYTGNPMQIIKSLL
ncbi:serine hydrolase [Paenibacillus sp. BIHB 4019]|uniref:serine hydrolase domain-containing protein n=1 Tax=Paenibacillus sp. BIHB 4019 TaxID=1870819 RepID=UPI001F349333|nr:serine hydrolase [Paenibacillus sp. BIHB 4019]